MCTDTKEQHFLTGETEYHIEETSLNGSPARTLLSFGLSQSFTINEKKIVPIKRLLRHANIKFKEISKISMRTKLVVIAYFGNYLKLPTAANLSACIQP